MSSAMLPSYAATFSPSLRPLQLSSRPEVLPMPSLSSKWASMSPPAGSFCQQQQPPAVSPNGALASAKKTRKSRVVFDFTTEEMAKYFHMSQREAAAQLGVATVTIKRNCRRLGIVWPYRLLKAKKLPTTHAPTTDGARWRAISRDQARQIREERAKARVQAKRNLSVVSAATAMTMLAQTPEAEQPQSPSLTAAGRAFALLPLECMAANDHQ